MTRASRICARRFCSCAGRRFRSCAGSVRDAREDSERGALARELVELRVAAPELIAAARVAGDHLRLTHRKRGPPGTNRAEARARRLGLLEQLEIDLDVVDLLHAADVRPAPCLVRV